jgi:hypothetical protein
MGCKKLLGASGELAGLRLDHGGDHRRDNEWHWARDVQLGEDAHRYANRNGSPVIAFLRTVVMNLLRLVGYRSIRQELMELAYDIEGMLALGSVAAAPEAP